MNSTRTPVLVLGALLALSGCRIEKPATVVPPPPSIDAFTASAAAVAAGDKVTLTWSTTNATAIELREATGGPLAVAVDAVDGSTEVTVSAASLYVLVARGAGGSDARSLSVQLADQGAAQVTFQAIPPAINGGDRATLAWSAPGARDVSLKAGSTTIDVGGQRSSGAVEVTPRFDTTYTLTVDGLVKTADVAVSPAILDAKLSTGAAEVGDAVTVSWSVAGAEKVTVSSPGRGQLFETTTQATIATGSFMDTVPPTPNNGIVTYELKATKGADVLTRTLELGVGTGLAITRFVAPAVAGAGASYTVRWETVSADQVEVKVDGASVYVTATPTSAAAGAFTLVAPAADFSVELVATNLRGGRISQLLQVDSVGVPTSATLTANPTSVAVGQPVTLTWASAEARRVRITTPRGEAVFSLQGQPAEAGSTMVYPTADTTYTLEADNLLGNPSVTATAQVTVTGTATGITQTPRTAINGQMVSLDSTTAGSLFYGFPHTLVLASTQADFIDISGTGAKVLESGADVATITLPFSTFLWGRNVSGPLTISRAGWIAWGAPLVVLTSNTSLPSFTAAPGLIAPLWDDLQLVAGTSGVFAQVVGSAPNERLIVQWNKVRYSTVSSTELTFQVQVDQRGMVSFQYATMTGASSTTANIGLQDFTRQAARVRTGIPASNSAVYFFSPVSPPVDAIALQGSGFSGYVKVGNVSTLITQPASAVRLPIDLGLTEVMFRPDPAVPNGQFVELLNRTGAPVDLSGWRLSSAANATWTVPDGTLLQPGVATVVAATTDSAQNDGLDAGLSWSGGFTLSPDAGSFTLGTADASVSFSYAGPGDAGYGSYVVDPGPFVGTSGSPGSVTCQSDAGFGGLTPQQLGSPGTANTGCGFGYTLVNIPYRFVDISDGGTRLINSPATAVTTSHTTIALDPMDAGVAPMVFGAARPQVTMSLDGWLYWGSTTTTSTSNTTVTSTTLSTRGKVAIFWDDLQTSANLTPASDLYWKRFEQGDDAQDPAPHWIFQWNRVRHASTTPPDDLTFEVKLYQDGTIEYHFAQMLSGTHDTYGSGTSSTIWLENPAGSQALVIGANQPVIRSFTAYRFIPR